jgi:peptide/nickel transport system permease protein
MIRMPVSAIIGLLLTGAFLLAAIFAPWIAPYGVA